MRAKENGYKPNFERCAKMTVFGSLYIGTLNAIIYKYYNPWYMTKIMPKVLPKFWVQNAPPWPPMKYAITSTIWDLMVIPGSAYSVGIFLLSMYDTRGDVEYSKNQVKLKIYNTVRAACVFLTFKKMFLYGFIPLNYRAVLGFTI